MPKYPNDPSFMQYLAQALRQGTISPTPPDPYATPQGVPVPQVTPQPQPGILPGMPGQAEDAIRRNQMLREQMMQQMGQ